MCVYIGLQHIYIHADQISCWVSLVFVRWTVWPVSGFNANLKFTTDGADESDDMLKKEFHGRVVTTALHYVREVWPIKRCWYLWREWWGVPIPNPIGDSFKLPCRGSKDSSQGNLPLNFKAHFIHGQKITYAALGIIPLTGVINLLENPPRYRWCSSVFPYMFLLNTSTCSELTH